MAWLTSFTERKKAHWTSYCLCLNSILSNQMKPQNYENTILTAVPYTWKAVLGRSWSLCSCNIRHWTLYSCNICQSSERNHFRLYFLFINTVVKVEVNLHLKSCHLRDLNLVHSCNLHQSSGRNHQPQPFVERSEKNLCLYKSLLHWKFESQYIEELIFYHFLCSWKCP